MKHCMPSHIFSSNKALAYFLRVVFTIPDPWRRSSMESVIVRYDMAWRFSSCYIRSNGCLNIGLWLGCPIERERLI